MTMYADLMRSFFTDGTQAVTVLITPRPQSGLWSDVASKPLFVAGDDWQRLLQPLGISHALRVDGAGRVTATPALLQRVKLEGEVKATVIQP